jgi:nicotinamidase-related amidase
MSSMKGHERFLTERDRAVFPRTGYGGRVGFGRRPVLLVIDVSYSFCGEEPQPILEAVETFHNSCGEEAWTAVAAIERVVAAARDKRVPVIYTTGYDEPIAGDFGLGRWVDKCPGEADDQYPRANEIVAPIAPRDHDIVIAKTMPSAFFATNLLSYLIALGADSILVCGVATSGCVRASVTDGFSHNYRMLVIEEGTFDRGEASHWINLFDMDMKYADVVGVDAAIEHLAALPEGLYDEAMPVLKAAGGREVVR